MTQHTEIQVLDHVYTYAEHGPRRKDGFQSVAWCEQLTSAQISLLERISFYKELPDDRSGLKPVIFSYALLGQQEFVFSRIESLQQKDLHGRQGLFFASNVVISRSDLETLRYEVFQLLAQPQLFLRPQAFTEHCLPPRTVQIAPVGPSPLDGIGPMAVAATIEALLASTGRRRMAVACGESGTILAILAAAWHAIPVPNRSQFSLRTPIDDPDRYSTAFRINGLLAAPASTSSDMTVIDLDRPEAAANDGGTYARSAARLLLSGKLARVEAMRAAFDTFVAPPDAATLDRVAALLEEIDGLTRAYDRDAFVRCTRVLPPLAAVAGDDWVAAQLSALLGADPGPEDAAGHLAALLEDADLYQPVPAEWHAVLARLLRRAITGGAPADLVALAAALWREAPDLPDWARPAVEEAAAGVFPDLGDRIARASEAKTETASALRWLEAARPLFDLGSEGALRAMVRSLLARPAVAHRPPELLRAVIAPRGGAPTLTRDDWRALAGQLLDGSEERAAGALISFLAAEHGDNPASLPNWEALEAFAEAARRSGRWKMFMASVGGAPPLLLARLCADAYSHVAADERWALVDTFASALRRAPEAAAAAALCELGEALAPDLALAALETIGRRLIDDRGKRPSPEPLAGAVEALAPALVTSSQPGVILDLVRGLLLPAEREGERPLSRPEREERLAQALAPLGRAPEGPASAEVRFVAAALDAFARADDGAGGGWEGDARAPAAETLASARARALSPAAAAASAEFLIDAVRPSRGAAAVALAWRLFALAEGDRGAGAPDRPDADDERARRFADAVAGQTLLAEEWAALLRSLWSWRPREAMLGSLLCGLREAPGRTRRETGEAISRLWYWVDSNHERRTSDDEVIWDRYFVLPDIRLICAGMAAAEHGDRGAFAGAEA